MLLPEREAREKICPLQQPKDGQPVYCLGSQCMMWRYRQKGDKSSDAEGYCGVAGKPMGAL